MGSSYIVYTSVTAPGLAEIADEFNAFAETYDGSEIPDDKTLPGYFDAGYVHVSGVDALDYFKTLPTEEKASDAFMTPCTHWRIDEMGYLYDSGMKNHSVVAQLHHFINIFFVPRGIKLNGAIVGCNTEYAHVFAYRVKDNIITLDEPVTVKYLKQYTALVTLAEDAGDGEGVSPRDRMKLVQRMCDAMGIDASGCTHTMMSHFHWGAPMRTKAGRSGTGAAAGWGSPGEVADQACTIM